MNLTRRQKRMVLVALVVIGVAAAATLALRAFNDNLLYYYSPSQVASGEAPSNRPFRVGGLVEKGSVQRTPGTLKVRFVLTDTRKEVPVVFTGILPDLFREGQGIVAHGRYIDGVFQADDVLAKHDENYMPPDVADSLKQAHAAAVKEREKSGGKP